MVTRRSVLAGLGGLVVGGGALIGTGAFTTVQAERTVNIDTAGDADAFLGITPAGRADDSSSTPSSGNEYVTQTGDTVQIDLTDTSGDGDEDDAGIGLNRRAITTFRNLVTITNNGTQTVTSLRIGFDSDDVPSGINSVDDTFDIPVDDSSGSDTVENNTDVLGSSATQNELAPGESISFGLQIDLINGGNTDVSPPDLPNGDYALTIRAETANTQ